MSSKLLKNEAYPQKDCCAHFTNMKQSVEFL